MPVRLLRYHRDTGALQGLWEGSPVEQLQAQIVTDDPTHRYLKLGAQAPQADLPAQEVLDGWYVAHDTLTAKAILTLTAQPNPFPADGETACAITVEPFVPCTLLVQGTSYALTAEDRLLVLTSEIPAQFEVRLAPMATHRATPMTVEARHAPLPS